MAKHHLVEKAKKLFDSYESKFNPYGESGKGPGLHYENMFKYGDLMNEQGRDFDIDAYRIAVWLHDIGHYVPNLDENLGDKNYKRDAHKDKGVEIFDKEFKEHIRDRGLEEKLYACIKYHSGALDEQGRNYLTKHPELQVIREADRISFLHPSFTEHNLKYIEDKNELESLATLLKRNYEELTNVVEPSNDVLSIADEWKEDSEKQIRQHSQNLEAA